ncbi:MAG: putative DNA binding domain-containing protein [Candidatus Eisenbacteria bacterium]|nr:putative DNA binding domain-containing protein [Candidatus Eisenbacteria bacterium]
MDLLKLLACPEGKTLEFKRDLSSPEGVLRTIVAFANSSGGTLVVGVEDGTHHVSGLSDPEGTEQRLVNLMSDRISPRLAPEIEWVGWRRTHVLVVRVHLGSRPPYHLVPDGVEKATFVRVGSTNRRADPYLIDELRRAARGEAFDEQPVPELDSEAIDFRVASESFAPVRQLEMRDLEPLGLLATHRGRLVPTNLLHAIPEALFFLERHLDRGFEIGRLRRVERQQFPALAIREALVNAVVHADYSQRGAPIRVALFSDRLEVENPGLLPAGLTVTDLQRGVSRLRNRVIGRVFHALGLVEQWGSDIHRIVSSCHEAGLGAPRFEELAARFRVTMGGNRDGGESLDATSRRILLMLTTSGSMLPGQIAREIGLTSRATRTRLNTLAAAGLIRVVGSGENDPHRRYILVTADE